MMVFTPISSQRSIDKLSAKLIVGRRRQHRFISSNLAGAQEGFGEYVKAERRCVIGVGFVNRDEGAGLFARHASELIAVQFKIVTLGLQNVLLDFDAQCPNDCLQGCWRRVDAFTVTKIRVGPVSANNLETA